MVVILPPGGKRPAMPTLLQGYGSYGQLSPFTVVQPLLAAVGRARRRARVLRHARRRRARPLPGTKADAPKRKPNAQADFIACCRETDFGRLRDAEDTGCLGYKRRRSARAARSAEAAGPVRALVPRVAMLNATRLGAAPNGANQFA
jgi:prolyl oligopeptidase